MPDEIVNMTGKLSAEGRMIVNLSDEVQALEKTIKILKEQIKSKSKTDYQLGREDERGAILSFLNFGSIDSPERRKWVSLIESKAHLH